VPSGAKLIYLPYDVETTAYWEWTDNYTEWVDVTQVYYSGDEAAYTSVRHDGQYAIGNPGGHHAQVRHIMDVALPSALWGAMEVELHATVYGTRGVQYGLIIYNWTTGAYVGVGTGASGNNEDLDFDETVSTGLPGDYICQSGGNQGHIRIGVNTVARNYEYRCDYLELRVTRW